MNLVQQLLTAGKTWTEVARITGKTRRTVAYHAKRLKGGTPDTKFARRYVWQHVQIYAKKHTVAQCAVKFGFSKSSWSAAVKRGALEARPRQKARPLEAVMVRNSSYSRRYLKKRILANKLMPHRCAVCGCEPFWRGKPLILILDHVNGVNSDHRKENLRFACPNCASQFDTHCAKNIARVAQL